MLELMSHISMELHSLTEVTLDSCSSFQRNKNERFFLCKDVNYLIGCFTVSQIVFNCDDFDMKQFDIDDYKSLKKIIFNSIDAKFIEFSFTKQTLLEANFVSNQHSGLFPLL